MEAAETDTRPLIAQNMSKPNISQALLVDDHELF